MKSLLLLLITLSNVFCQPSKESKPLVFFYDFNPWNMVIGSESPLIAIYTDGTAIYRDNNFKKELKFLCTKLQQEELNEVDFSKLDSIKSFYSLTNFTDQPTSTIRYWKLDSCKHITIYGGINWTGYRDSIPKKLRIMINKLLSIDKRDGKSWHPNKIEIIIWPFDYAKKSINWPKSWPKPNIKYPINNNDLYMFFLDWSEYKSLKRFIGGLNRYTAVLIDNNKWSISYRFPFEMEDMCLK